MTAYRTAAKLPVPEPQHDLERVLRNTPLNAGGHGDVHFCQKCKHFWEGPLDQPIYPTTICSRGGCAECWRDNVRVGHCIRIGGPNGRNAFSCHVCGDIWDAYAPGSVERAHRRHIRIVQTALAVAAVVVSWLMTR